MGILIMVGEASGDQHGAKLITALRGSDSSLRFTGVGGERMREAGVDTFSNIQGLGVVGGIEIASALPALWRIYRRFLEEMKGGLYEAIILIDYPGFNLRLARAAKRRGLSVIYFIAPQVWAWWRSRVKDMARWVDLVLSILPFEAEFYRKAGIEAHYVGHPLVGELRGVPDKRRAREELGLPPDSPVVGLLPGSRERELRSLLPPMLGAARDVQRVFPETRFLLPLAYTLSPRAVNEYLTDKTLDVRILEGVTLKAMSASDFLMVASGTATLEAGLLGVPMVIVYRVNGLTYWLTKNFLIKIPYIGLVNIVAGRLVVPELIQADVTPGNIAREALKVLGDGSYGEEVRARLGGVKGILGEREAYGEAASQIVSFLKRAV